MTVSYSGTLLRLIYHWKGSLWKAIWREILAWLILYYCLRFALEKAFDPSQRKPINDAILTFQKMVKELPMNFMLTLYVSQVLTRWWNQVQSLPWPDDSMSLVNAYLTKGETEENLRLRRHSIARYLILTQIIALSGVSTRIRKRFPTLEHIVDAGLMTTEEHQMMMNCPCPNLRWQLPLQWAQNLIIPLVGVGPNLISPTSATSIYRELNNYRAGLRSVFMHDWITIPLVITQATGVGLYGYFLLSLLGRQTLADDYETLIPFGAIVKFCSYVGWFRVAQDLLRPFGEDDDDVELNYLIERHINVAMSLASQPNMKGPTLEPDLLFGQKKISLPHTKLSNQIADKPPSMMASFKFKHEDDLVYDHNEAVNNELANRSLKRAFTGGDREKMLTLFF